MSYCDKTFTGLLINNTSTRASIISGDCRIHTFPEANASYGVGVAVGVEVPVGVNVAVGVNVFVGVVVGVNVGVDVAVAVGVGVDVLVGVGLGNAIGYNATVN